MPVRLSTPLGFNLGDDVQRVGGVMLDKTSRRSGAAAACPVLNVSTCEVVNTAIVGGTAPWVLTGGFLPFGLTLHADGTITGQVATFAPAGPTPWQATDSKGAVIDCVANVTLCSTLEVDHPIIQTFHPAPFDGTGMTPILFNNVPPQVPFFSDVIQFRYLAGTLISNNTSRVPFPPVVPCPIVPTSPTTETQGFIPDGFPVVFNQEASMTLGGGAYGGGLTALNNVSDAIGPCVRIRKTNSAFPLEFGGVTGNNVTCYGFFVQFETNGGVPAFHSFIGIRAAGLTILHNFALNNVAPGDVLTIQSLCENTFIRAKVNGVTVYEAGAVHFGCDLPGVAGIIGGINIPTFCNQIWATDFSAATLV